MNTIIKEILFDFIKAYKSSISKERDEAIELAVDKVEALINQERQEIIEQIKEKIKEDNKPLSYGATLNNDICEYGCVYRVLEIIKTLTKQK